MVGLLHAQTMGVIAQGIGVYPVPSYFYYINGNAAFNLTPYAQDIPGWTDLVGDPTESVLTATAPNGVTVSTVGTDTTLWRGDPDNSDAGAETIGMPFSTPDDPFGFTFPQGVERTGFVNAKSQFVPGTYNFKISNLSQDSLYQILILGSYYDSVATQSHYPYPESHNIYAVCKNLNDEKHIVTTVYNNSRAAYFDTVKADSNGDIWLSLTGSDSTLFTDDGWTKPVISGIVINTISKTATEDSLGTTALYRTFYDTVLMLNDGVKDRPVIVYRPYNYNSSQSYSLVYYQAGNESKVEDDNWDTQYMTNFGLSVVAEKLQGKMYGLDANGDTVSYVIIQPQMSRGESMSADQIDQLITQFRSKNLYNLNDSLYVGAFSSGAADVLNFVFDDSWKVKGAFVQSFFQLPTHLHDSLQSVIDNGVKFFVTDRDDPDAANSDTLISLIPDSLLSVRTWHRNHTGFPWEYVPGNRIYDPLHQQNMLDFFANFQKQHQAAFFAMRLTNTAHVPSYYTNVRGTSSIFSNPTQEILTGTDSATGWTLNTVATSKWTWSTPAGTSYTNTLKWYPYYAPYYVLNEAIVGNSKAYNFATNGADLQITGLNANQGYEIYVLSTGPEGNTTTFSTSEMSVDYVNSLDASKQNWMRLDGTSDASGVLGIGMYGKSTGDVGLLKAMIVVKK